MIYFTGQHWKHFLEAFKIYEIEVTGIEGNRVKLQKNYEVEVQKNKLFKRMDDGYIIAPFSDLNELCRFIAEYNI
ncbi:MAG TPA: hypothetical protein PLA68_08510 [Panacibacter sp.]|nr:hypothetical protein [Panacibacter sp.]